MIKQLSTCIWDIRGSGIMRVIISLLFKTYECFEHFREEIVAVLIWNLYYCECCDPLRVLRMLNDLTILPIGTDIDWQYQTTNEMNACLSTNGSCSWPRGRNLGGTSVHNGMMYNRGHAKDFDNWEAMGNPGWSWRDVRSYKPVPTDYFQYFE